MGELTYKQPFGEVLRGMRDVRGISMRSLADSAGMDPGYLSRLENGKTGAPKLDTVKKLAAALCNEQQLEESECERLTRQLLVSANHLQTREELIDDLGDRFSARLRDEGFPEDKIDEALARVPMATMRKVLLGEENLEIGYLSNFSSNQLEARKDTGENILTFKHRSAPDSKKPILPAGKVSESATTYLDRHAEDFTAHRREKRTQSSQAPHRTIRAGREAEIRLHRSISKEQEQQLRLIAKLINSIMEEKN